MIRLVLSMLPVALPSMLSAQTPDAGELVRRSAEAVKKYRSYQIDSLIVVDMRGGPVLPKIEMPSSIRVRRPDRMRIESRSRAGSMTIVGDGEHTWYYLSSRNQFVKRDASLSPEAAVSGAIPSNLPDVSKSIASVKMAGEDSITVEGKSYPCWKVETDYREIHVAAQNATVRDAVEIAWISKAEELTLQTDFHSNIFLSGSEEPIEMTQSTRTTALRLNVDLPDWIFAFKPPEGAEEADDWSLPGLAKPDVVGKPAPAVKVKAMDGAEIDLAALKGKVVLLDFWTSWCSPARREMPNLEKLHKEFGDLVVVGMNVGEDRSTVEEFLKSAGVSYPIVAVDDSAELLAALSVSAYPTMVLVDRDGRIASYEVGVRGEQGLRSDLEKLGVHSK